MAGLVAAIHVCDLVPALNVDARHNAGHDDQNRLYALYLILDSRNSTCFLATGSYFFFTNLSVMVREFFRVT
jgi:hypothetical protein